MTTTQVSRKVYLVSSGRYSDYHIVACFDTREAADEFASLFHQDYDANHVEEYILGGPARDAIRFVAYGAPSDLADGSLAFHHERMATLDEEASDPPGVVAGQNAAGKKWINVHGYGRTADAARKSAIDAYYAWKAKNEGVTA